MCSGFFSITLCSTKNCSIIWNKKKLLVVNVGLRVVKKKCRYIKSSSTKKVALCTTPYPFGKEYHVKVCKLP